MVLLSCGLAIVGGCKDKTSGMPLPPPPVVTVARPVEREVVDYDEYTGQLKAVAEVDVQAKVRGYLVAIGFKDGDQVKKGQMLFQIDPRPFEAQLQAAEGQVGVIKAQRMKAEADVKRYRDLVPKGAATAQDLDKALGELGEATAGIEAAEAQVQEAKLNLAYARITSPLDGVAGRANFTEGNLIGASSGSQVLTTIVEMDPIQVYFDVDQRALQRYRAQAMQRRAGAGEPTSIRDWNIAFQFGLASEEGFPHRGVLDFIDNRVDPSTGTIAVRGKVPNGEGNLKPGYFARVRVAGGAAYRAVLVNDQAIGTQQGQKYVLVVDPQNKVDIRPVKLGALQEDGLRVIASGVKPGDRVVVNGMQRARPGTVVTPESGDMLPQAGGRTAAAGVSVEGH
jgi:membrane fusion protein, multidrug efflux system